MPTPLTVTETLTTSCNYSAFQTFFRIHLINVYSSFQNNVHTTKQMQYTLERILSDFLSDGFLIFFKNIDMSMELYNGEKSVAQPSVVMTYVALVCKCLRCRKSTIMD